MKTHSLICFFLLYSSILHAQTETRVENINDERLESIVASTENTEIDDDAWAQKMEQFKRDPVDLNEATEQDLSEFQIISPLLIQQFFAYRRLNGSFISMYELQAVPGWEPAIIRKIRPFVTVSDLTSLKNIFQTAGKADHILLLRVSQSLEKSKGYSPGSGTGYLGSPQKIFLRYTLRFKKNIEAGILGEKDAGEPFFGPKQKLGFDFYSFHVSLKHIGKIDELIIGDFSVNMGQGLIQWQSLAFKKSSEISLIKKQGPVLRPYHSAGEINFHRGLGVAMSKRNWNLSVFGSLKKIDGNLLDDTATSLQTSGYHRTENENADKGAISQLSGGVNINFHKRQLKIGLNAIHFRLDKAILKSDEPYNLFAVTGQHFTNFSLEYAYTLPNMHFFGEIAADRHMATAFLNGLIMSASSTTDLSFLYRNISSRYRSLYSNAFTESSSPNNETGFYAGICVRPAPAWTINTYFDLFKFNWLKYRVDAPSRGADGLVQVAYKPNKNSELTARFHSGIKEANASVEETVMSFTAPVLTHEFRIVLDHSLNRQLRIRVLNQFTRLIKSPVTEGYSGSCDLFINPSKKRYSGSLRLQYFETADYDTRIYSLEHDILYSNSIPVFFGKGFHYYLNFNLSFNKNLQLWGRLAQTVYPGKTSTGSGFEEISGNRKTEVKLQVQYKF